MNLISGKGETSSRLPAFSLFLPGSCPNYRDRRSQRAAPGSIDHEICRDYLRASRTGINPDTLHGVVGLRRHNLGYPALRPQRDIPDRFSPTAQHKLDQWPGCAEQRDSEIAFRHEADIRPLELDILRDPHRDSASSGKIIREARENFVERPKASSQKRMGVSILGGARPRADNCREAVPFQNLDPLKAIC